ncbi:MAG: hypothetical protein ACJ74U_20325 [Jatrophihabitantaceae bacterium]
MSHDPDWPSELRLSLSTEPTDADAARRPAGSGIPVRWCALLAVLALVAAAGGGSLLTTRRGRTMTSTLVRYQHPAGVDLTGCPRAGSCLPLPAPDAALNSQLPPELGSATVLIGSLLLDNASGTTVRTLQVLATGGVTLAVTGQCIAGAGPVPAHDTEPAPPVAGGPVEVALVRPGRRAGCSVALLARIPAGRPVPMRLLRQLADELPTRLVN